MSKLRLKDMVEMALKDHSKDTPTRNSDIALTHYIWRRWYSVGETMAIRRMYDLPTESAIGRWRRAFQTQYLYVPTSLKVAKARKLEIAKWKETLGYPVPGDASRQAFATHAEIDKQLVETVKPVAHAVSWMDEGETPYRR